MFASAPDRPVPGDPKGLAQALAATTEAERRSVEDWLRSDATPPPDELVLQALFQQRIYPVLARDPRLAGLSYPLLPGWLEGEDRATHRPFEAC